MPENRPRVIASGAAAPEARANAAQGSRPESIEAALLEAALDGASATELLDRVRAAALRVGCRRFDAAILGGAMPARVEAATHACFVELAQSPAAMSALEVGVGETHASPPVIGTQYALTERLARVPGDLALLVCAYDLGERVPDPERLRAWIARLHRHLALCLRAAAQAVQPAALGAMRSELDAITRAVSHDLRAPVRRIEGYARLLAEDCSAHLDETGRGYVGRISALCESMQAMYEGLLNVSRSAGGELRRERVDLGALAKSICADLLATDGVRDGKLTVRGEVIAYADTGMMRALMENLVGNAWKFTRCRSFAEIEVGARFDYGRPVFYVRDNGVGFDMRLRDRLFMPFQRLHSATEYPGTGVGLATVQRIVTRHGGTIWAESKPGEGACFSFSLAPADGADAAP